MRFASTSRQPGCGRSANCPVKLVEPRLQPDLAVPICLIPSRPASPLKRIIRVLKACSKTLHEVIFHAR